MNFSIQLHRCSKLERAIAEVQFPGGYSHARRTECAKKLVCEKPKTKLAESQFFKKNFEIVLKNPCFCLKTIIVSF